MVHQKLTSLVKLIAVLFLLGSAPAFSMSVEQGQHSAFTIAAKPTTNPGKKAKAKIKAKAKAKAKKVVKGKAAGNHKKAKATKPSRPSYTRRNDPGSNLGAWLFVGFFLVLALVVATTVWYEYRPTVYASGKKYGPTEYLPARIGGAFTATYDGDPQLAYQGMSHQSSQQEPTKKPSQSVEPVTVTREPLRPSVNRPKAG